MESKDNDNYIQFKWTIHNASLHMLKDNMSLKKMFNLENSTWQIELYMTSHSGIVGIDLTLVHAQESLGIIGWSVELEGSNQVMKTSKPIVFRHLRARSFPTFISNVILQSCIQLPCNTWTLDLRLIKMVD